MYVDLLWMWSSVFEEAGMEPVQRCCLFLMLELVSSGQEAGVGDRISTQSGGQ